MKKRFFANLGIFLLASLFALNPMHAQRLPSVVPGPTPPIQTGGEVAATAAADVWLGLLDDGQYDRTYETAAKILQNLVGKQNFVDLLNKKRTPLGKLVSRKMQSATASHNLQGAPEGQYVVIQYNTEFEHKKVAAETVTVALDTAGGGQWRVSGYYVR